MRIPLISRALRQRRIHGLVDRIALHEAELRDYCAQLIDLTEPGDDLHVEIRRLLEALDG
jgi:hypothetical protein